MRNLIKSQKGASAILIIVLILVVGVGVFLFFNSREGANEQIEGTSLAGSEDSDRNDTPGDNSLPPATGRLEGDGTEYNPEDNEILDLLLNNFESQAAVLEDVDGSGSSGTAYRLYDNGTLYHAVIATMPPPASGNVYEGWLVQTSPLKFFSTGVMRSPEEGVWVLEYTGEMEYPTYLRVVITEEQTLDATPERHVIEGDF